MQISINLEIFDLLEPNFFLLPVEKSTWHFSSPSFFFLLIKSPTKAPEKSKKMHWMQRCPHCWEKEEEGARFFLSFLDDKKVSHLSLLLHLPRHPLLRFKKTLKTKTTWRAFLHFFPNLHPLGKLLKHHLVGEKNATSFLESLWVCNSIGVAICGKDFSVTSWWEKITGNVAH